MIKNTFIKLIILLGVFSFSACSLDGKEKIGIMGTIKDNLGNPLTDVSISYRTSSTSVLTDAIGAYNVVEPRTLFIDFKKMGYHTLSTKITDFSEEASYDFSTIQLKKINNPNAKYNDISLSTTPNLKKLKLFGHVFNAFKEPLKNVKITLIDTITESYSLSKYGNKNGSFHFKKQENLITIKKEGFKELLIGLPVSEKGSQNVTLLKNSNKKGIYIIKSGKYTALPQVRLSHKSEEKIGSVLWGGTFSYNITDFFYPDKVKAFKIEKDSIIRFVIYEPLYSSKLNKAQNEDGYLCTVNYKHSASPFPNTEVSVNEIYPPKYSKRIVGQPKIVEFNPMDTNMNYVFVNSKNKKGYYFTH